MQFLGPKPKGKYVIGSILDLLSSENLSGSNVSGFGKYFGSRIIAYTGITIP